MSLAVMLCINVEITQSCMDQFADFKKKYARSYENESAPLQNFCNNLDILSHLNCTSCGVNSVFDQDFPSIIEPENKSYRKLFQAKGASATCTKTSCVIDHEVAKLKKVPQSVDLRELGLIGHTDNQGQQALSTGISVASLVQNMILLDRERIANKFWKYRTAENLSISAQFIHSNTFNRFQYDIDLQLQNYIATEANDQEFHSYELTENYPWNPSNSTYSAMYAAKQRLPYSDEISKNHYFPFRTFVHTNTNADGTNDSFLVPLIDLSYNGAFDESRVINYLARGISVITCVDIMSANMNNFIYYTGGVANSSPCQDHKCYKILPIIGYGVKDGKKVWIVQNNWGQSWGSQGSIYVARGNNDFCIEENIIATVPYNYNDRKEGVFKNKGLPTIYDIERGSQNGLDKDSGKMMTITYPDGYDKSVGGKSNGSTTWIIVGVVVGVVVIAAVISVFIYMKKMKNARMMARVNGNRDIVV